MQIAFVQVASWGDCANSTMMFKPLLEKYKDAKLHVFTSTLYASAFENNPRISALHKFEAKSKNTAFDLYNTIPPIIEQMRLFDKDKIFIPAPILRAGKRNSLKYPEVGENLWCTFWRALEEADVPYEAPLLAEIYLTDAEKTNARNWVKTLAAPKANKGRVLMECYAESGQTYWNEEWMRQVATFFLTRGHQVIMSNKNVTPVMQSLINKGATALTLPMRECIEVFNHTDIFISISSGFCNACRSTAATKNNTMWFEAVNSPTVSSRTLIRKDSAGVNEFFYNNDLNGFLAVLKRYFD